jgi:hypothetical protein
MPRRASSSLRSSSKTARSALLLTMILGGCNRYALFNEAGYEQATFNDEADILFVIDNSASMQEETAALGGNFDAFISVLTSSEGAAPATESLTDAVNNYITYTQERGKFLDYNLALTTTSAGFAEVDGPQPGNGGVFVGEALSKSDPDVGNTFRAQLLCETAVWDSNDVPDGETMTECAEPPKDADGRPQITKGYLDCFCGPGLWEDNASGSGREEPLEAALMAICRASDAPPETCSDPQSEYGDFPTPKNEGWLRDESTVLVVVVSDEGDDSRRLVNGDDVGQAYIDAFAQFERNIKIVAIAPGIEEATGNVICPSTAIPTYSLERMQNISTITGGFYRNIAEEVEGDACQVSNFDSYLRDLGALLANLDTAFQLQSVPDVSTIRVWIDDVEVPASPVLEGEAGQPDAVYGDGWSYDPAQNSVTFWGEWIPGYNADVDIFYLPLSGAPRELPF